jgi:hypothetical protein
MKTLNTIVLSSLLAATAFAGTASANLSTGSLALDIQSAVGTGHVSAVVQDGVATLFGNTESLYDAKAAEYAAANFEGIERVESRIFVSN